MKAVKLLLIGLLIGSPGVFAQEEKAESQGEKVKLELVWEKEFEKEVINVVASDDRTLVFTQESMIAVDNLTGAETERVPIYRGEGRLAMRRTQVFPSKNGKYSGLIHHVALNEKSQKLGTEKTRLYIFELIDNTLRTIWQKEKEVHESAEFYAPTLCVSSQGYVIETDLNWNGKLYFYDPSGQLIREVKLSENTFENGICHRESFSDNGDYFAIFSDEGVKNDENWPSYVILYDKEGNEIGRHQESTFKTSYSGDIAISPAGNFIVALRFKKLLRTFQRIDNSLKLLWEKPVPIGYYKILFSEDGKNILLSNSGVRNQATLYHFDVESGTLLWKYSTDKGERITLKRFSDNYLIVGRKKQEDIEVIEIFSRDGTQIYSKPITSFTLTTQQKVHQLEKGIVKTYGKKIYCFAISKEK